MNSLREIASVFLKLGFISFGGPAAHIAMMEDEVVQKRKWMPEEKFLDLVGATNLIPGPNSTEMSMHCGYIRRGFQGLVTAGLCFIFPAATLTLIFAYFYHSYGSTPAVLPFIYGIKPAVIAIILNAIRNLGKKAVKDVPTSIIGLLTLILAFLGINEVVLILGTGLTGALILNVIRKDLTLPGIVIPLISVSEPVRSEVDLLKLFLVFLKIGSVLFGSGYVLVAYLEADLVDNFHWLSRQQLLDAVAIGQLTPGPVLTTATFIGYQLAGIRGAFLATLAIFLPSFIFVSLLNPLVPKIRKSKRASAFLDSVNVASLSIMFYVAIKLGIDFVLEWKTTVILIYAILIYTVFRRINPLLLVLTASLLGYVLHLAETAI